jgi:hypothetical protein
MAAVDGTWEILVQTPMGARKGTLVVKSEGESFTGSFSAGAGASDVKAGKVSGDTIRCSADLTQPMQMTVEIEATVSAGSISGAVKIPGFGTCPLSGKRA